MNCNESKEALGAYVTGELSGAELESVRSHVESCASCGKEAREYAEALRALKETGETVPVADKDFFKGLSRRLDESDIRTGRKAQPSFRLSFIASVAAAAAAVLMIANVLLPRFDARAPRESGELAHIESPYNNFTPISVPYVTLVGNPPSPVRRVHWSPGTPVGLVPVGNSSGGCVAMDEYWRLEMRLKALEAKLEAIENSKGAPVSK